MQSQGDTWTPCSADIVKAQEGENDKASIRNQASTERESDAVKAAIHAAYSYFSLDVGLNNFGKRSSHEFHGHFLASDTILVKPCFSCASFSQ